MEPDRKEIANMTNQMDILLSKYFDLQKMIRIVVKPVAPIPLTEP